MKHVRILFTIALSIHLFGCESPVSTIAPVPQHPLPYLKMAKKYSSCDEIRDHVKELRAAYEADQAKYQRWSESQPVTVVPALSSTGRITNNQEASVDEADSVKITSRNIYFTQSNTIQIVSRSTRKSIGAIDLGNVYDVELIATDDRLFVVSTVEKGVELRIYEEKTTAAPNLISTTLFDGRNAGTRLLGNRLYLVSESYLDPVEVKDDKIHGVHCDRIHASRLDDFDYRFTSITMIDTKTLATDAMGLFGGGDVVYLTSHSLYIVKHGIEWYPWDTRAELQGLRDQSIVTRLSIDSNEMDYVGSGVVSGSIDNSRWLDEKVNQRALVVVSTEHDQMWRTESRVTSLSMEASKGELLTMAKTLPFGENETVRSVRHVDDHLYVVTFKKTDPLFAFDLSDVAVPRLMSALEITGFSAYLHDLPDDLLLGIGYDADDQGSFSLARGIQVSLFDLTNHDRPVVITQEVLGTRGSFLPAARDPHAFQFESTRSRVSIPISILDEKGVMRSGALIKKIVNRRLVDDAFLTHADLVPTACESYRTQPRWWMDHLANMDIERVFDLDGALVTISRFGMRFQNAASPTSLISTVTFANREDECLRLRQTPVLQF